MAIKRDLPIDKVFIVAELSGNHKQNIDRAKEIIKAAAWAGADAIKVQTYTPDTITLDCDNKYFQITQGTIWDGQTLYNLYKEAYTPWEWQSELKKYAEELGLIFFSSPFDLSAVDFLEELDVPFYKIASFEINDIQLIRYVARKGKPIIISTGVATVQEIEEAIETCRQENNNQIILLKCTSAYPTPLNEVNLNVITDIREKFRVRVGLSDHTLGYSVALGAVALGACIVEKHLTISRKDGGVDSAFSMEPEEFRQMVNGIREVEKALGSVNYELTEKQRQSAYFKRSLFSSRDIQIGEVFSEDNIKSVRPGEGLNTKYYESLMGRKATEFIPKGTPLKWKLVE